MEIGLGAACGYFECIAAAAVCCKACAAKRGGPVKTAVRALRQSGIGKGSIWTAKTVKLAQDPARCYLKDPPQVIRAAENGRAIEVRIGAGYERAVGRAAVRAGESVLNGQRPANGHLENSTAADSPD